MIHGNPSIYFDNPNYLVLDLEFDGHPRDVDGRVVLGITSQNGVYASWHGGSVVGYQSPPETSTQSDLGAFSGGMPELVSLVESVCASGGFLVAHNAVAELGWLARHGLDLRKVVVYDTMLAEWVLAAGLPQRQGQLSLEGVAKRRSLGVKSEWTTILFDVVKASELPVSALIERCVNDVALTDRAFKAQLLELNKKDQKLKSRKSIEEEAKEQELYSNGIAPAEWSPLAAVQYCRSMMTPMLVDLQREHLLLDKALVDSEYQTAVQQREQYARELYTMTEGININSGPQLGAYVYGKLGFECKVKTPSGAPSVSEDALDALIPKTKEQRAFKELISKYHALNFLITKNLELFYGLCDEFDSKLWVEIQQGTTVTHRFSSVGVPFKHSTWKQAKRAQGQNIPRDLKHLFKAPDGYLIGEVDGSALEFRVAASMSGDRVALDEIANLYDIHSATADVYGCSRQDAKPRTFKPLYGGTGGSPTDKKYSQFFRKKYKTINDMQERWVTEAMLTKQVASPFGIRYNFPDITMDARGYCNRKRDIYNWPIQGGATGEIIPIAMALMWYNQPDGVRMVSQVHDSVICYVKPEARDAWLDLSIWALTIGCRDFLKRVYRYDVGEVELGIGAKLGTHWGVGEEQTYQTDAGGQVFEVVKSPDGKKQKVAVTRGSTCNG